MLSSSSLRFSCSSARSHLYCRSLPCSKLKTTEPCILVALKIGLPHPISQSAKAAAMCKIAKSSAGNTLILQFSLHRLAIAALPTEDTVLLLIASAAEVGVCLEGTLQRTRCAFMGTTRVLGHSMTQRWNHGRPSACLVMFGKAISHKRHLLSWQIYVRSTRLVWCLLMSIRAQLQPNLGGGRGCPMRTKRNHSSRVLAKRLGITLGFRVSSSPSR